MKVFIPLTDAILDGLDGTETLVPYRPGLPLSGPTNAAGPPAGKRLSPDPVRGRRPAAPPAPLPCPR